MGDSHSHHHYREGSGQNSPNQETTKKLSLPGKRKPGEKSHQPRGASVLAKREQLDGFSHPRTQWEQVRREHWRLHWRLLPQLKLAQLQDASPIALVFPIWMFCFFYVVKHTWWRMHSPNRFQAPFCCAEYIHPHCSVTIPTRDLQATSLTFSDTSWERGLWVCTVPVPQ